MHQFNQSMPIVAFPPVGYGPCPYLQEGRTELRKGEDESKQSEPSAPLHDDEGPRAPRYVALARRRSPCLALVQPCLFGVAEK